MSSFTDSKKADAQATFPNSPNNQTNDGEDKSNNSQTIGERPAYLTENIGAAPSPQHAPDPVGARAQRITRNAGDQSAPRRIDWTAVRSHPSGEESFAKYLDDGAFVAAGSRPAPPPAPETFVPAAFPTLRDEELMEKGEKLGLHDGKGHGDVVDEVAYKGRGKAQKEEGGKKTGGVESKSGKADDKKQTVGGKKKFGSFNAILYGPPAVDGNDEEK